MSQAVASSIAAPTAAPGDALLDDLDLSPGLHALVIGRDTLETLCGLIRRGCAGAAELRPDEHGGPRPESVQLAVLPDPASLAEAAISVVIARRALADGGRIAILDAGGLHRRELAAQLRAQGFVAVGTRPSGGGVLVFGECPASDARA